MFCLSASSRVFNASLLSKRFLNRACGLVGYPNVGKSTLFNAITQTQLAAAENYPFCTIDPNISKVTVPDPLLESLAAKANSKKVVTGQVEVRDIAGIIKGAKDGAGMGNQFLSHIRGVHAILQVVRCFEDTRIAHVEDVLNLSPIDEFEAVGMELLLSDLEVAQKRLPQVRKRALNDPVAAAQLPILEKTYEALEKGIYPREVLSAAERVVAEDFNLITTKPILVVCNVDADSASKGNKLSDVLQAHLKPRGIPSIVLCAQLEFEACMLANDGDKDFAAATLREYGLDEPALPRVAQKARELLNLKTYYTIGVQEARSWFIPIDAKLPEAGAAIHTDFMNGFQGADVLRPKEVLEFGLEGAKAKGLSKPKNKEYVVLEGDIIEFKDPKKKK